ncbi:endonuclease domain-containing protein [Chloroflexota bacterium]
MLPYNKNLKQISRQLRQNMTMAERHLWSKVRMKQLKGHQFYRQKPVGDYIVDFYCPGAKLVVEVDGGQHFAGEMVGNDRVRDEHMRSLGLRVLRFTNTEVLANIDGVVESIEEEIPGGIPLNPREGIPLIPPFAKGETALPLPLSKKEAGPPLPFVKGDTEGF